MNAMLEAFRNGVTATVNVRCGGCGHRISLVARQCRQCGLPNVGRSRWLLRGLIAEVFAIGLMLYLIHRWN